MDLSVMDIAALCGVGRSTVSYWIAKGGLPAHRIRNKYTVRSEDLLIFLEDTGRSVPAPLGEPDGEPALPMASPLPPCWYAAGRGMVLDQCRECGVFANRLPVCLGQGHAQDPESTCNACAYYHQHLRPRLVFIQQMAQPAMIVFEHTVLAANAAMGRLCGADADRLMGLGVERLLHGASMKKWLVYHQHRMRQAPGIAQRFHATVCRWGKLPVSTIFYVGALLDPPRSWLVLVEVPAADGSVQGCG